MYACNARQRGMSIIELMVGIVIAMLVSLAAASSAMVFTASQRQGVGAGGVGISASTALAAIKNDAALAGLGFFGDAKYLCQNLALSEDDVVKVDGTAFTPLSVTVDGTDDRIDVIYADRVEAGANVLLNAASDGSSAEVMSLMPAAVGDAVLLAPAAGGGTCLVRTVTAQVASTEDSPQTLTFDNTGEHNKKAFSTAPAFAEKDRIALLGSLNWNRYRRVDDTLVLERPLTGESAVLARNVIALRAQYGITAAAAGATTLENWQAPSGAFATLDAAELPRVRALRLGMVTRSPVAQKPDAGGNCEATLDKPEVFGEQITPAGADWKCYRYRVTTVVVPLRNLVLGLK
ncbi:MAG: PilW family protein [Rubrivivax sp.]|nr:PilW family protein [Rubrivivax sp.]